MHHVCTGAFGGQRRVSGFLELELGGFVQLFEYWLPRLALRQGEMVLYDFEANLVYMGSS